MVRLPRMPRLCYLRPFRAFCPADSVAVVAAAALFLLPGCGSVPTAAEPVAPHEAMFPSLKLNEDLWKSFQPSNHRDWTPEQALLARADFKGDHVIVHNIRNCR